MPPLIALSLCFAFVFLLFRRERKKGPHFPGALWIPLIWMIISGSRFVSQWIFPNTFQANPEEGSPLDAAIFLGLIFSGFAVMLRRNIQWGNFVKHNVWLTLFIGYAGLSVFWSDFPFVAFKRWIKEFGNLIMVLIILSEHDHPSIIKQLFSRFAYLLVPLSIVLIKYFPDYGRTFSPWGGAEYTGVGLNKNYLGFLCLTCSFFFFWRILGWWKDRRNVSKIWKKEGLLYLVFMAMLFWLFGMSNSATSVMCFVIGSCILVGVDLSVIKQHKERIGIIFCGICLSLIYLETSFGLSDLVFDLMGREKSFTDRVPLWNEVLALGTNPIFGEGYNSFWITDGARRFSESLWWHPNSTHNGYLDTYMNLGWIGICFLVLVIYSAFRKATRTLYSDFDYGRFRLGWLIIVLFYNVTETAFAGLHLIWFVFLLLLVDYPKTVIPDNQLQQATNTA
jgi:exopolysaccharide production protein ExoQ